LAVNSPSFSLSPGNSAKISAEYTVTLADLDAGKVVRAGLINGQDPDNLSIITTIEEFSVYGIQNPELSIVETALNSTFSLTGEVINYTIQVTNSGNVSILSTAVTDTNAVIINGRPNTILLPGESFTVSASHVITQDDLDKGKVLNIAVAAGFDLRGATIEKKSKTVTITGIQQRELTVSNTSTQSLFKKVGETIKFNIRIRNTGNISLYSVAASDPALLTDIQTPLTSLLPGESKSFPASHTVTQLDLDNGMVVSNVMITAVDQNNLKAEALCNQVIVIGEQNPELTATAKTSAIDFCQEGDEIRFVVVISNTGNVTLNDIYLADIKGFLQFKGKILSLAPGEGDSIVTIHRVTYDDINSGKISMVGVANGYINAQKFSFTTNEVIVHLKIENFNLGNFPNPFAYQTTIVFDLPEKGEVIFKAYDMTGREIIELRKQEYSEGRNFVNLQTLSTRKGMYILRMYFKGSQAAKIITITN